MPRPPALPKLEIENLGPIRNASLEFGDLTVGSTSLDTDPREEFPLDRPNHSAAPPPLPRR